MGSTLQPLMMKLEEEEVILVAIRRRWPSVVLPIAMEDASPNSRLPALASM